MSNIYYDALWSSTSQGSLSSVNNELVSRNAGDFTAAYNVYAIGYNQADVTVGGAVSAINPLTFTVYKYNNGIGGLGGSTLTVSVSSTTPIPCALLLNTGGINRPIRAVPFTIASGRTYVDVDLSAATVDFSDDTTRRLRLLGYI